MNKKGFTLLEIVLVVAIISMISAFSMPAYYTMYIRNELDIAANAYAQSMRRAQVLSRAQMNNDTWGTYIGRGHVTVFLGSDYDVRDIDYDERFDFPTNIKISGLRETTFTGIYGFPEKAGETKLTAPDGATRVVSINVGGVVDY